MNAAIVIYIICALNGLGLFVAGVFILAGLGWSLLAASVSMLAISAFIRSGLSGGYSTGGRING